MTEDKQTNILQSNVTEKDHPVSEVKASIEEIKEENCPEKDPHVSTTVIIKPGMERMYCVLDIRQLCVHCLFQVFHFLEE